MTANLNNIKILNAFSLTEVLVTMFVIMLLIIASAPMITKKNAKNKAPHGTWECYLDDNGKHEANFVYEPMNQTLTLLTKDFKRIESSLDYSLKRKSKR